MSKIMKPSNELWLRMKFHHELIKQFNQELRMELLEKGIILQNENAIIDTNSSYPLKK